MAKIGFTQVPDKLNVSKEEGKAWTIRNYPGRALMVVGGVALSISLAFNFFGGKEETVKEQPQKVVVTETKTIEPVASPKQESSKQESPKYTVGNEAIQLYGDQLMKYFNTEIQSSPYDKYFKGSFSIVDDKTFMMTVDVNNASEMMPASVKNVKEGIVQGSNSYRVYLNRFDNRIWNGKGEGLTLRITDTDGTVITELKKN